MDSSIRPARSTLRVMLRPGSWPFVAVQLAAVAGVVAMGWSWSGLLLAVALYYVRMFFITAGYHRYFSHRAYRTSRFFQFVLAVGGATCTQKGPLWWAARHRHHHKFSDMPEDIHSPRQDGFWWSHMGWFMGDDYTDEDGKKVPDLAKYPELVWLDRFMLVPPIAFAVGLFLVGGLHALLWGFFVSTTLLWHGVFTINSLSHVFGSRRYETTDTSRNNGLLALITMGEGWHNNHHHYQSSANQGFYWWELDLSYWVLRALGLFGVVWELRTPPVAVLAAGRRAAAVEAPAAPPAPV
jgi:stearoyl-CoA desaturase (delta-9 desaturase)